MQKTPGNPHGYEGHLPKNPVFGLELSNSGDQTIAALHIGFRGPDSLFVGEEPTAAGVIDGVDQVAELAGGNDHHLTTFRVVEQERLDRDPATGFVVHFTTP